MGHDYSAMGCDCTSCEDAATDAVFDQDRLAAALEQITALAGVLPIVLGQTERQRREDRERRDSLRRIGQKLTSVARLTLDSEDELHCSREDCNGPGPILTAAAARLECPAHAIESMQSNGYSEAYPAQFAVLNIEPRIMEIRSAGSDVADAVAVAIDGAALEIADALDAVEREAIKEAFEDEQERRRGVIQTQRRIANWPGQHRLLMFRRLVAVVMTIAAGVLILGGAWLAAIPCLFLVYSAHNVDTRHGVAKGSRADLANLVNNWRFDVEEHGTALWALMLAQASAAPHIAHPYLFPEGRPELPRG